MSDDSEHIKRIMEQLEKAIPELRDLPDTLDDALIQRGVVVGNIVLLSGNQWTITKVSDRTVQLHNGHVYVYKDFTELKEVYAHEP